MTLDDVLFAASCAAPFVVAYGAARLWVDRRRIFRRDPPHLRDRVPVECGAGETTLRMFDDFGPVGWSPPSDAVGRAFLRSLPPDSTLMGLVRRLSTATTETIEIMGNTAILMRHREFFEKKAHAAIKRHKGDRATVEFPTYQPGTFEVRVFRDGVHVASTLNEPIPGHKPSPADNARRYTQEESTW